MLLVQHEDVKTFFPRLRKRHPCWILLIEHGIPPPKTIYLLRAVVRISLMTCWPGEPSGPIIHNMPWTAYGASTSTIAPAYSKTLIMMKGSPAFAFAPWISAICSLPLSCYFRDVVLRNLQSKSTKPKSRKKRKIAHKKPKKKFIENEVTYIQPEPLRWEKVPHSLNIQNSVKTSAHPFHTNTE